MFCLSIIVPFIISQRFNKRNINIISGLATIIFLLEMVPIKFSTHMIDQNLTTKLKKIAQEKDKIILNLPVDFLGARGGGDQYVYDQTYHHQNIIGGYVSRESTIALRFMGKSDFLKDFHHNDYDKNGKSHIEDYDASSFLSSIKDLHVDYIILSKSWNNFTVSKSLIETSPELILEGDFKHKIIYRVQKSRATPLPN